MDENTEVLNTKQSKKCRRKKRDGSELSFEEKYLAKLERYRKHMAKVRLNETPEQYKARLERARIHAAKTRQAETPEQRAARLERARLYKSESRKNETPEQRLKRLETARLQTLKYRQKQTAEQREARLDRARRYNYLMRQNEAPEQRDARLEYTRKYMAQMRKYKIFSGMISQAEKDQWRALQALIDPTIKTNYNNANNNALLPKFQNQLSESDLCYDQLENSSSPERLEGIQWPPIEEAQLPIETTLCEMKEDLNVEKIFDTISSDNSLNGSPCSVKSEQFTPEQNDMFLFNSITSDIPPLQHEVEMVLNYKVLKNPKQPEHPCPHCKKVYRYTHSLKKHLNVHHTVE